MSVNVASSSPAGGASSTALSSDDTFLQCQRELPFSRGNENPPGPAERLAAIRALKIENGTIVRLERRTSPIETFYGHLNNNVKPRTVVDIVLNPAKGSNINVEMTLPDPENWNGRLLGTGNGGPGGRISDGLWMATFGWAVVTTDMGTAPNPQAGIETPEQSGVGNREVWKDFGFRATHLMTLVAKRIVKAYYGEDASRSYFFGGSTGGQQALQEAQLHPEDYDGVIANVPAHCRTPLHAYFLWNYQIFQKRPFTKSQLESVAAAGKEYMAGRELTPMTAGFAISDPRHSAEDVEGVIALARRKDPTLGQEHADALRKLFDGPSHAVTGERVFGGVPFGSNFDLSSGHLFLFNWVFGADVNLAAVNFADDLDKYTAALAPLLNAENPDLTPFEKRGGKMLSFVGSADACVPFHATLDYYERVAERCGGLENVQAFYRIYLVPDMGHGVKAGMLETLETLVRWREKGEAPKAINLRVPSAKGEIEMPIYPYPEKTAWDAAKKAFKPVAGPRGGVEPVAARFKPPFSEI